MPVRKKELKVRLTEAELEKFSTMAFERGKLKTQDILMAAINLWYAGEGTAPFGDLTKQEERILKGILAYLREKPYSVDKEDYVVTVLEKLAKRYAGK